jgi:hypothetical protein
MAHNLSEADNYNATVSVPDNGDAAVVASVETAFQALTNRTNKHKLDLSFLATSGRTTTDGIKRLRQVADLAALAALVVGAGDAGMAVTVRRVGVYLYEHGVAAGFANGVTSVAASGNTGVWFAVGYGPNLNNVPFGVPALNNVGQILSTAVPNRFLSHSELNQNATGITRTNRGATSVTTFNNASDVLTLNSLVAGDILDLSLVCHAQQTTGGEGFVALAVVDNGVTTQLAIAHVTQVGAVVVLHLRAKHTVSANGNVQVRPQIATNGTGTLTVFSPLKISAVVHRL